MNEQYQYNEDDISIDLRDLCFYLLKRWKSLVIVMLIGALLGGGYATFHNRSIQSAVDLSSADSIKEQMNEEQKAHDEEIVRLKEEKERLVATLENEQEYMQDSLLMNIDPYHVYRASSNILVTTTSQLSDTELYFLGQSIGNRAYSDDFLKNAANTFDSDVKYLSELFSVEVEPNNASVSFKTNEMTAEDVGNNVEADLYNRVSNSAIIKVSVLAKSAEDSDTLLSMLVEQLTSVDNSSIEQMRVETVAAVVGVDRDLMDMQEAAMTRSTKLRKQIQEANDEYDSLDTDSGEALGFKSVKKFAVVGGVGLLFVILILYVLTYIMSGKIRTEDDITMRFGKLVLGCYPSYGRYDKDIISSNLALDIATLAGQNKVIHCVGTADNTKIQTLVDSINKNNVEKQKKIQLEVLGNILKNSENRASLERTKQILLIEEKNVTKYSDVKQEIKVLDRYNCDITGVVLL